VLSASEADKAGIQVSSYQEGIRIDFAFTDAEVIEEGTLAAVIGRRKTESGEPSFMDEKAMAKSAEKLAFIFVNDNYVTGVEGSIPVLVKSGNWIDTAEEIDDLFLGDAEVWRRPSFGTAGPLGGDHPLVTKEGHHVLDVIFTIPIPDLRMLLARSLQLDISLNPVTIYSVKSFFFEGIYSVKALAGRCDIFVTGQVAEKLDKIAGVVDHGIICSNQYISAHKQTQ